MAKSTDELLELGKISGVYGVKGWVKVHSYTDPREQIVEYGVWQLKQKGARREVELEAGRCQGKTVIAKLKGIDDRDQAMLLMGSVIAIHPQQLGELEENEYYWHDLEGMQVINQQGVELGTVSHMVETGANDVMVVIGERERLIPFTQGHAVIQVDLPGRVIKVDWDAEF